MTPAVSKEARGNILHDARGLLSRYQRATKRNAWKITYKIKDLTEFRRALSSDCVVGYVRRFAIDRIAENRNDIKRLAHENAINKRTITYYQRIVSQCALVVKAEQAASDIINMVGEIENR